MGLKTVQVQMSAKEWGSRGPLPGHYTGAGMVGAALPIQCPLCEQSWLRLVLVDQSRAQSESDKRMKRLTDVWVDPANEEVYLGLAVIVPDTHQVVGCGVCHVAFTILKEAIP